MIPGTRIENRTVKRWNAQFRHRGSSEEGAFDDPLGVLQLLTKPPMSGEW